MMNDNPAGVARNNQARNQVRREHYNRIIFANEEQLLSLVQPTATMRLILERRGVRFHLPESVLRADRRASTVLSEHLTAVETTRWRHQVEQLPLRELRRYNEEVIQTIRLFLLYREFQFWQNSQLPDDDV